jgi:hypothetical protein
MERISSCFFLMGYVSQNVMYSVCNVYLSCVKNIIYRERTLFVSLNVIQDTVKLHRNGNT